MGKSKREKLYYVWYGMKYRCDNEKHIGYKNYGGRGITYDKRWKNFDNFYEDMKEGYKEGLSLERIDNDGDYSKENCKWADRVTQCNNKTNNTLIEYDGQTLTLTQWARKYDLVPATLKGRLKRGLTMKEALEKPLYYSHFKQAHKRFHVQ